MSLASVLTLQLVDKEGNTQEVSCERDCYCDVTAVVVFFPVLPGRVNHALSVLPQYHGIKGPGQIARLYNLTNAT